MKRTFSGPKWPFKPEPQRIKKKTKPKKPPVPTTPASSEVQKPKRKPVWKIVPTDWEASRHVDPASLPGHLDVTKPWTANEKNDPSGAVRNGWYSQRYDPEFISGCDRSCRVCRGREDRIAV